MGTYTWWYICLFLLGFTLYTAMHVGHLYKREKHVGLKIFPSLCKFQNLKTRTAENNAILKGVYWTTVEWLIFPFLIFLLYVEF